jgi:hypothetical protein
MALAMKHIKRIDHLYHTGNSFQQNCADLQFLLFFVSSTAPLRRQILALQWRVCLTRRR